MIDTIELSANYQVEIIVTPEGVVEVALPGLPGANGTNGSVWRSAAGAPSNSLGVNGDYYLNTTNGDVHFKSGGSYSVVSNIRGPSGSPGANGSVWRSAAGAPSNGLGADGDYYLNTANGDVLFKSSGTYSVVDNLTGPPGPGSGDVSGPTSSTNNNLAAFSGTTGKAILDSGVSIASLLLAANIGSTVQGFDADLAAIAALAGTSGLLRKTGTNTWALDTASYLTSLGIGSQTQAWDADLDAIAALAGTGLLRRTGPNTWTLDTAAYLTSL
ncbi:MAG: hypothetical protein IOC86_13005, partial [Aestuariivirga sp.]|nr:hypothetical protein [Aestuariivirga sp.]